VKLTTAQSVPTRRRLDPYHARSLALIQRCGLSSTAVLPEEMDSNAAADSELFHAAYAIADDLHKDGILRRSDWAMTCLTINRADRAALITFLAG